MSCFSSSSSSSTQLNLRFVSARLGVDVVVVVVILLVRLVHQPDYVDNSCGSCCDGDKDYEDEADYSFAD